MLSVQKFRKWKYLKLLATYAENKKLIVGLSLTLTTQNLIN